MMAQCRKLLKKFVLFRIRNLLLDRMRVRLIFLLFVTMSLKLALKHIQDIMNPSKRLSCYRQYITRRVNQPTGQPKVSVVLCECTCRYIFNENMHFALKHTYRQ